MRVVQLIDSLEAGGAERMAVSYANALYEKIAFSGIIVTRNEGNLKNQLKEDVFYLFLAKNKVLDIKALLNARKFLIKHKVQFVQAHSTSIYFAFLLKLITPNIKIIWHDHFGKSEMLENRKSFLLKIISMFVFGIVAVNQKLRTWSLNNLFCKKVVYLANFTTESNKVILKKTELKGVFGKRIICLANLRPQKNHFFLLNIIEKFKSSFPDWTFHLVGKDFNDTYSEKIKKIISDNELDGSVFLYGSCQDVSDILKQCQIGVLTSDSEGLPVALLEYGFQKLAVVSTAVGEIPSVIEDGKSGLLFQCNDELLFQKHLIGLIENISYRKTLGENLKKTILDIYSEETVLIKYLSWLNEK